MAASNDENWWALLLTFADEHTQSFVVDWPKNIACILHEPYLELKESMKEKVIIIINDHLCSFFYWVLNYQAFLVYFIVRNGGLRFCPG